MTQHQLLPLTRILVASSLILTLTMSAIIPNQAFAQGGPAAGSNSQQLSGPRKQLVTIVFAGLAGAILGLSTLSFYSRPQDRLSNIAVGFAFGIIIGTGYSTYKAATAPRDIFRAELEEVSGLKTYGLLAPRPAPQLAYSFSF